MKSNLLLDIINYAVRSLIIVIGFIMVTGLFLDADSFDDFTVIRVVGVVFILFGFYRILLYRANKKRFEDKK